MDLKTFLHIVLESGFALFCVLSAIYIRQYDSGVHKVTKILSAGLIADAVINIADALAYFYRGDPSRTGYFMVRISNFVVFCGMFILLALCNLLLDEVIKSRNAGQGNRLRNAAYALSAAGIAMLFLSLPFGFLYCFDDVNIYHRGKVYILIPLIAVAAMAIMISRTVKERWVLSKDEFYAFMCFYILPLIGAILQTVYYGISLANIANSISLLLMLTVFIREAIAGISVKRSFILSGEGIENISHDLDNFLEAVGTERQNRIRIRFTVEDALYHIWQHVGELEMVKVVATIVFGKPSIRIEHRGTAFNPFTKSLSSKDEWSGNMLASAGLSPAYSYSHETNIIRIPLNRMRVNPVITILLAIMLGLVSGTVALAALSEGDVRFVTEGLLLPVYDLWNNILYSISAPAMFIIVMSTMLDTREVSEQGGNAGVTTGRYMLISLLVGLSAFAGGFMVSAGSYRFDHVTRYTIADLIKKFFSIIPQNLLDPIKDFNTAQLILMGIVFAYATMAVGQQANGISSFIHELNLISAQLASWISNIMPLFTVFLTAQLVLQKNAGLLLILLRIIPFALILSIVIMIGTLLAVSLREHISASILLKKLWPTFIQTLKTGQVTDTYAMAEKCCIKELGIRKVFTERMMPLGLVLYMPVSIIGMAAFVIFAAFVSNVTITPVWMITAIVFALIMTIAAPPIPGVNILSYVVIIGQLGLGMEFIIVAVIFDVIFNMFASAANQTMLQLDLILQADHVGMLKHSVLNSDAGAR